MIIAGKQVRQIFRSLPQPSHSPTIFHTPTLRLRQPLRPQTLTWQVKQSQWTLQTAAAGDGKGAKVCVLGEQWPIVAARYLPVRTPTA